MRRSVRGSLYLLVATMIWGSTFVAQSVGMDYIGPFTFQAVRCFLAVLVLLPAVLYMDGNPSLFLKKWMDRRLWFSGIACGLALFVASNLQQIGLIDTDAGKAGFLTAMYIVIVPFIGIFLRKKPSFTAVISVVIAVVGLYLLSCVGVSQMQVGDILLLGCAFAFAVQITLVDYAVGKVDNLRLSCIQSLVCAVLSAVVTVFAEKPDVMQIVDCWFPLCYAGILSMGVAYTLQIFGQRHVESTKASLIMSLESVFAALSGWLFLREQMKPWEMAGCALVFIAVLLSQVHIKKPAKTEEVYGHR